MSLMFRSFVLDFHSEDVFLRDYVDKRPVILLNVTENSLFRQRVAGDGLRKHFGDLPVVLTSSDSSSTAKRKTTFNEYLDSLGLHEKDEGNALTSWYLFGDYPRDTWDPHLSEYRVPPWRYVAPLDASAALFLGDKPQRAEYALSFGVGRAQSGVSFHRHGPVFAETLRGRKHWYIAHKNVPLSLLQYDPNRTTAEWLVSSRDEVANQVDLMECTIQPGEVLYIPAMWHHATLNLDAPTVFMSTFFS